MNRLNSNSIKFQFFTVLPKIMGKVFRPNFCTNFVPGQYVLKEIYQKPHIFLGKMSDGLLQQQFCSLRDAKMLGNMNVHYTFQMRLSGQMCNPGTQHKIQRQCFAVGGLVRAFP